MFELSSIMFKDNETGKTIEVHIPDGILNPDEDLSEEEIIDCSICAAILLSGGIRELKVYQDIRAK